MKRVKNAALNIGSDGCMTAVPSVYSGWISLPLPFTTQVRNYFSNLQTPFRIILSG